MGEPGVIHSPMLEGTGVTALFTTRIGGVSRPPYDSFNLGHGIGDDESTVADNLNLLVAAAGLASLPHQASQVHGTASHHCTGKGKIHAVEADILVTTDPGCPVGVRTADCLPILLADPVNRVAAAVHAGWRGTAARIAARAVEAMLEHGACLDRISASLGPCIGPCCFTIGEDTADRLAASAGEADKSVFRSPQFSADLSAINIMQLGEAGIAVQRIESGQPCTSCHPQLFYSHRRDKGVTGRHLAVVALSVDH